MKHSYHLLHDAGCRSCKEIAEILHESSHKTIQLKALTDPWVSEHLSDAQIASLRGPALVDTSGGTVRVLQGAQLMLKLAALIGPRKSVMVARAANRRSVNPLAPLLSRRRVLQGTAVVSGASILTAMQSLPVSAEAVPTRISPTTLTGFNANEALTRFMSQPATLAFNDHQLGTGNLRNTSGNVVNEYMVAYNGNVTDRLQVISASYLSHSTGQPAGVIGGYSLARTTQGATAPWSYTSGATLVSTSAEANGFAAQDFRFNASQVSPSGYGVTTQLIDNVWYRVLKGPGGQTIKKHPVSMAGGSPLSQYSCSDCQRYMGLVFGLECGLSGVLAAALLCGLATGGTCAVVVGVLYAILCAGLGVYYPEQLCELSGDC